MRISAFRIAVAVLSFYVLLLILLRLGLIAADFQTVREDMVYQNPSWRFWAGTDIFGRSIAARALHGLQTALLVGLGATTIAVAIGSVLGALAGFFEKWIDDAVVWLYTTVDSVPYILLLGAFAWALGPGLTNVMISLGLTSWTTLARLVRAEVLKQKNQDYVLAARALGVKESRIVFGHILPNTFHLMGIQAGLVLIFSIKIEVILSFLGLGVTPDTPSWGMMIDDGKQEISQGLWGNILAPSVLMLALILPLYIVLEGFRKKFLKSDLRL